MHILRTKQRHRMLLRLALTELTNKELTTTYFLAPLNFSFICPVGTQASSRIVRITYCWSGWRAQITREETTECWGHWPLKITLPWLVPWQVAGEDLICIWTAWSPSNWVIYADILFVTFKKKNQQKIQIASFTAKWNIPLQTQWFS